MDFNEGALSPYSSNAPGTRLPALYGMRHQITIAECSSSTDTKSHVFTRSTNHLWQTPNSNKLSTKIVALIVDNSKDVQECFERVQLWLSKEIESKISNVPMA